MKKIEEKGRVTCGFTRPKIILRLRGKNHVAHLTVKVVCSMANYHRH